MQFRTKPNEYRFALGALIAGVAFLMALEPVRNFVCEA